MTKSNRSMRSILINFVKANGPQSWTSLHKVVLTVAGKSLKNNGYGSSYLDQVSSGVTACLPTKTDKQFLKKDNATGLYSYSKMD